MQITFSNLLKEIENSAQLSMATCTKWNSKSMSLPRCLRKYEFCAHRRKIEVIILKSMASEIFKFQNLKGRHHWVGPIFIE